MKKYSLFKNIVYGLIISFSILSLFEIILRTLPFSQFLSYQWTANELVDHSVFWQPLSDHKNPLKVYRHWKKYRGKKFSQKLKNEKRILIFGGSHVYGWPFDNNKLTFPYIAEKLLKKYNKNINIINCGEGGFTSFQGLLYLKKEIYYLNPDIVIFCFGANDGSTNKNILTTMTDKQFWKTINNSSKNKLLISIHKTLNKLYSYNLLKFIIFNIKCYFTKKTARVPTTDFEDNLKEFLALGNKYKFIPVFMSVAHKHINANIKYRKIYEKFTNNVYIDMHKLIENDNIKRKDLFIDDMHLNEKGHQIVGKILKEKIIETGILKK